jgi:hypothetical protein
MALLHASAALAAEDGIHKGTVTYAKDAGGYTYLKIKESGKELWLAALPMKVAIGDQVEYAGGDVMTNFPSKAMDKTFDSIRFVTRIHVVGKDAPQAAAKKDAMPKDDFHKGITPPKESTPPRKGEIAIPKGAKSVEEVFNEKEKLNGSRIAVRAKVMKVSKNILGKNWVTLADGTGSQPDDRFVAASLELPAVGDIVTASGILKTNVSLGAGYQYKAILEDAKFTK